MIKLILVPIVGAIIGYATNWIAVKMLFRPLHEVRVFGIKLPFTPGVIPRGQSRLARAVGKAVEGQLLTLEVLEGVLLTEDMKGKVRTAVEEWIRKQEVSELTLREAVSTAVEEYDLPVLSLLSLPKVEPVSEDKVIIDDEPEIEDESVIDDQPEIEVESFSEGGPEREDESFSEDGLVIEDKAVNDEPVSEDKARRMFDSFKDYLTEAFYEKLLAMNVGSIVAGKVLEAAREKLAESMFGMMIGGSVLEPVAAMVEEKVNSYTEEYGRDHIRQMVESESHRLGDKTIMEVAAKLKEHDVDLPGMTVSLYEDIIHRNLPMALSALNLSSVVENRINAMDVAEVEALLLSIMKKELGAIVNLGALIGFVLGLINVLILLI